MNEIYEVYQRTDLGVETPYFTLHFFIKKNPEKESLIPRKISFLRLTFARDLDGSHLLNFFRV